MNGIELFRDFERDDRGGLPGGDENETSHQGWSGIVGMDLPGSHAFALQGTLQDRLSAQRDLEELVDGHRGGHGTGCAPTHSCCQWKPLLQLQSHTESGSGSIQNRPGRGPGGVLPRIPRKAPLVPRDITNPHPGLIPADGSDLVSGAFQGQAKDVEPARHIPDGAGGENTARMAWTHRFSWIPLEWSRTMKNTRLTDSGQSVPPGFLLPGNSSGQTDFYPVR